LAELLSSVHDKDARNQQIHDAVRVHEYTLKAVADFVGLGHVRQGGVPRSPDPRRRHLRDELLQQHSFRLHAIDSGPACLNLR